VLSGQLPASGMNPGVLVAPFLLERLLGKAGRLRTPSDEGAYDCWYYQPVTGLGIRSGLLVCGVSAFQGGIFRK